LIVYFDVYIDLFMTHPTKFPIALKD